MVGMNTSHGMTRGSALMLLGAMLAGIGCVERTISITSEPAGALVHLNDEEVGRTPLEVPFTFYGVYDVRLEQEGYKPLWTKQKTDAPWWEAPGPDLFAEMIPNNKVEQVWHFRMEPAPFVEEDDLIDRAVSLRESIDDSGAAEPAAE